jgi:uncharacterized Zn-finger protein
MSSAKELFQFIAVKAMTWVSHYPQIIATARKDNEAFFKFSAQPRRELIMKSIKIWECQSKYFFFHFHTMDRLVSPATFEELSSASEIAVKNSGSSKVKKLKKIKEFPCSQCGKVFKRNQHLQRHIKIHSRVYKCSKCDEQFDKWSLLQKHMKLHKFECFTCGKQLLSQKTLSMHLKTHDESIIFPCSVCKREFNRKQNLRVHYRTVHLGLKPFECVCGTSFGHKHLLMRHIRTFSGKGVHGKVTTALPMESNSDEETLKLSDLEEQFPEIAPEMVQQTELTAPTIPTQQNHTSDILNDLTGFEHPRFSADRPIACYVDGCCYRFKRIYDLQRHILSFHSTGVHADVELEEVSVH